MPWILLTSAGICTALSYGIVIALQLRLRCGRTEKGVRPPYDDLKPCGDDKRRDGRYRPPRGAGDSVHPIRASAGGHRRRGGGALVHNRRGALQEPLSAESEGRQALPAHRGAY